ncbi:hypothetical protein AB1Y20_014885 [Prymnesium parvum]|uniref:Secreted protein n=1 Tax=Prymnesium parvum TaxID=97485 RepID=A0AB34JZ58_PRYPA
MLLAAACFARSEFSASSSPVSVISLLGTFFKAAPTPLVLRSPSPSPQFVGSRPSRTPNPSSRERKRKVANEAYRN